MRIIGYVRVSTDEQALSGLGLEDQQAALNAGARERRWHLTFIEDAGYSAKTLNRPGITHALELLRTKQADGLAVAKLDRLSRSLMDFAGLIELSRKEQWTLVSLDLGVDTSTPQGEMMANVMMTFAQFERRLISERTRAALQALRHRGGQVGRQSGVSAGTRRSVAAWRASGCTLAAIAQRLNDDGVPTAQGGAQWYPSTVAAVLRSIELENERNAILSERAAS